MGKALDKFAFSVTKAGHKYDEKEYGSNANRYQENLDNMKEYGREHPAVGYMIGNDPVTKFNRGVARNRSLYLAEKHRKKENSYNPFAGWSDNEKRKADKKRLGSKK